MLIKIPTTKDRYFRQLLEILKPIKPFNKLMPKDLDVYAMLLRKYEEVGYKKIKIAHIYIFSADVRSSMANDLKMSQYQFNNSISRLRKVGIMDNNRLSESYILKFNKKLEILFNKNGKTV